MTASRMLMAGVAALALAIAPAMPGWAQGSGSPDIVEGTAEGLTATGGGIATGINSTGEGIAGGANEVGNGHGSQGHRAFHQVMVLAESAV